MKSVDCYVTKIEIEDAMHANVHVIPLDCVRDCGELDETKESVWRIDVSNFGFLRFLDFYVSYRIYNLESKIPNSRYHNYFKFDDDEHVVGISTVNGGTV